MKMTLRKAALTEMPRIEALMKLSMRLLGEGSYTPRQIESMCRYVCVPDKEIIEDGTYYVVEDEKGTLIGCGGWSFRATLYAGPENKAAKAETLNPKTDPARVRAMFVHTAAGGKGVGSLLLNAAEEAAKKKGFFKGALGATLSGLDFYKRKGWKVTREEKALLPDGVSIDVIQMEKKW